MGLLLNQVIALVKGEKTRGENALTKAYHTIQRAEPFTGISKTYQPKDEDGDRYPSTGNHVQLTVSQVIDELTKDMTRLFDLTATLDVGNTLATANVEIDGQ